MKGAWGLNDSIIGQTLGENELNNSDIIQADYWKWWKETWHKHSRRNWLKSSVNFCLLLSFFVKSLISFLISFDSNSAIYRNLFQ